jgi:predicted nucleic acid-binding protein
VLCDTDFLVALLRSDAHAIAKLEELAQRETVFCTTHLNVCELFKGANRSPNLRKAAEAVRALLGFFTILPFTLEADEEAERLLAALVRQGTPIGDIDAIIAGVALANQETVLTNNVKHFQAAKASVQRWSSSTTTH